MSLYQLDRADFEPEVTLRLYHAALAWAALRGDAFELALEPGVYDSTDDLAALSGLGTRQPGPSSSPLLGAGPVGDAVYIRGVPEARFIREMTSRKAPPRALAGDECPVEYVIIYVVERALYVCYDYGTVQVFDLATDELESLEEALRRVVRTPVRMLPVFRAPS